MTFKENQVIEETKHSLVHRPRVLGGGWQALLCRLCAAGRRTTWCVLGSQSSGLFSAQGKDM